MNRFGFLKALLALPFLPAWLRGLGSGKPKDDFEVWLRRAIEQEHHTDYWPPSDTYWDSGFNQEREWVWYRRGQNDGLLSVFENYLRSVGRGDEVWLVGEDGKLKRLPDGQAHWGKVAPARVGSRE